MSNRDKPNHSQSETKSNPCSNNDSQRERPRIVIVNEGANLRADNTKTQS